MMAADEDQTRHTRRLPADEPCRNCGDPAPGNFCPNCGQRKVHVQVSVRDILDDLLEDQLVVNPALPRTLGALLLRPGRLTNEYIRGRKVRYIAPFRLYLVSSVLFFLMISFLGMRAIDRARVGDAPTSMDVDSIRAELLERRAELQEIDTADMGPTPRALMRQAIDNNRAALALLADTTLVFDTVMFRNVVRLARGEATVPLGTLQPWARDIQLSAAHPMLERAMHRKLAQVGHLPPQQAFRTVAGELLNYAPHMMFVLLPLFALLLKLLYIRRGRYYAEHFVFALHVHAFFFLSFFIMAVTPDMIDSLLMLWMIVYMWLAMKRVYRQGWFRTTVKWWVLAWMYSIIVMFGLLGLAVTTLLFT